MRLANKRKEPLGCIEIHKDKGGTRKPHTVRQTLGREKVQSTVDTNVTVI